MNSTNISLKQRRKGIISIAYNQGKVFERFKEKEKFIKLVSELGIHKNTIIFRTYIFKLCERYPKLLKSSIGLEFLKNYHKGIKTVWKENEEDFRFKKILSFKTKPVTQVFITNGPVKILKPFYAIIFV